MTAYNVQDVDSASAVSFHVADGVATIRIDQPGKPVNVLSAAVVAELEQAIARLESGADGARAAVIASGKPGVWIAGADVDQLKDVRTAAEGADLSRTGHALLGRLEGLPIPIVAAIDGAALGGGLEVALACSYRLASDSPRTKLGLPEVQLGLLPGAGGTQRLPRLVGLAGALDLMLTGKQLDGRRARKIGLVDEVVPADILIERARRAAIEIADRKLRPRAGRRRGSPTWTENLPGVRAFIFKKARKGVLDKTHGLYPAPLRIVEVVEAGLDLPLAEGLAVEADAFGELIVTPEARSLTHLFLASTEARNDPMLDGAVPADVERVAIVGAGFMGSGIAAVSAENGLSVRMKDVSLESVAKGLSVARQSIRGWAERRRMPEHEVVRVLDRVAGTHEYVGFSSIDLAIEAVFEDLELKHRVLREIEAAIPVGAVLASNTSTIPIADLAPATARPDRVIGLHFFSPVEKMPLVEIIVAPDTTPAAAATCHAYAKRIGKTPIIVHDAPGFYVNRILGPYMNEAVLLLEQGAVIEEVDAAMVAWGFPVGPFTLFDEVGIDVAARSGRILAAASKAGVEPSPVLDRMLADDRRGRKNGRGFYRYEGGERKGPDESVYPLLGAADRRAFPPEEIQQRLVLGMVNEAVRTLEDGVLRSPRDGDVGAVFGFGFPAFRGGPFWYLDAEGAARVLDRLRGLEALLGPRFAPAGMLVEKAASGVGFHAGER